MIIQISSDENIFETKPLILGSKGNEESSSDLNSLKIDDLNIQIKKENKNLNFNEDFYDLDKIRKGIIYMKYFHHVIC